MKDVKIVLIALMMSAKYVTLVFICIFQKEDAMINALKDSMEIMLLESVKNVWNSAFNVQMFRCAMFAKVGIILQVKLVLMRHLFYMALYLICQASQVI